MAKKVASISISGEITLNLHSLNNEGGEGNQIMTRQLTIIDKEGHEHTVNGISGDMFKHIHVGHLINYASEHKLSLCEGCAISDPNRISLDSKFISILKGVDPEQFDEEDLKKYQEINNAISLMIDDSSKEYKDAIKELKTIEKKYIIQKITDDNDKTEYQSLAILIETKLNKKDDNFAEKKKQQDDAKKKKKEIEKKYSLDFSNEEKIDKLLEACIVDDVHGVLITAEKNNLPRKSVIEFAWTVGIPDKNNTETYVHTKLVADAGEKGSGTGSNEGQNIFHRPANHGTYAFVCNLDAYRIGFNDISRKYSIEDTERLNRYKAILQSLLSSFLNPKGAMTSTQKPHITDFKGVVAISYKLLPAPTISSINPEYLKEITTITKNLNSIEPDSIEIKKFEGLGELSGIIADLIKNEPYKIN
jgi:CRISPR-associated autoregulator DevR family